MNFKEMKKNSSKNLEKLVSELNKTGKNYKDDRIWSPTTDPATGRGTALIRFLPATSSAGVPWVMYTSYSFQGPGGWYIENSPRTIDLPCPVAEDNNILWTSGVEANKDIVRKRKMRKNYISNILVISDPKNPENEGKVFLYKYGSQVHKKIASAMQPEFEDKEAFDPFDFWKGANFRIRIKRGENKMPNYEDSAFEAITPLFDGKDAELEKIWNQEYDITEFISEKNFKSYEELKSRFERVIGANKREDRKENESQVVRKSSKHQATTPKDDDLPWPSDDEDNVESVAGCNSEVADDDDDDDDTLEKLKRLSL